MASQAFTFFQTGNLTPDPPTSITTSIVGTSWTNSWVNAITGRAPTGFKVTTYATATPGTAIQTTNVPLLTNQTPPVFLTSKTAFKSTATTCATSSPFTAAAGSVIVLFSGVEQTTAVTLNVSSISGLGLTWTKQYASGMQAGYSGGNGSQQQEIWYAINNTANPITDIITVTYSQIFDDQAMIIASFSGCDLSNPWLSGGGATASGASGIPTVTLPAINKANTLALSFTGTNYLNDPSYTSGWTNLNSVTNNGATNYEYIAVSYKSFTSPQSAQTISALFTSTYWVHITSVLVAQSPSSIPTITYASPSYAYGTQYGISVQSSNIQGKLSPATTALATWLAQPTLTVTMTGTTLIVVGSSAGATGYTYTVTATPATNPPTITNTTGTFTCSVLVQYVANVYARAVNSQSIVSANSASVWCLTMPAITAGTASANNIYNAGTRIVGNTFTIVWTAGDVNASGYSIFLNGGGTPNTTTTTLSTTFTVSTGNSYYATVSATASNSTSQIASTYAYIACLASPVISSINISGVTFNIYWSGILNAASYTLYINGAYNSLLASSSTSVSITVSTGNSYYATLYATATYSTSAVSTASLTIYCLAAPTITVGASYTNISGTAFKTSWSSVANATSYYIEIYYVTANGDILWQYDSIPLYDTTELIFYYSTYTGTLFYTKIYALATNSISVASTKSPSIWCLTSPSITSGTTTISSTTFTVTWTAGDGNASGYTIYLNGTGTPNTTTTGLTTQFAVSQGSVYYATLYATALYSTSAFKQTATIPCILLTFTLSMSVATLTASVAATPTGYGYSYSSVTLLSGNTASLTTVSSTSLSSTNTNTYPSLTKGLDYGITVSATYSSTSSTGTGNSIPRSIMVPCIRITFTLKMSGTTLTPNVSISPSSNTYDAGLYTYTLSNYVLGVNNIVGVPTYLTSTVAYASTATTSLSSSFTAAASSVIVLFSGVEQTTAVTLNVSSISGLGLTWTKQYASGMQAGHSGGNGSQQQEIWYAINNTANPITDTITVTYSQTFDDQAMIIASFSGCDLSNPWLSGGGATASGASGIPTVTLPAINKANTLALSFTGSNNNNGVNNYTSGWTNLNTKLNAGATYWENIAVSYKSFASTQSAQTISALFTSTYWVHITSVLVGYSSSSGNFTGLTTGTSYNVSASATNYGLTESFEIVTLTTNSGLWAYTPTWNLWTFSTYAGIAIAGCTWAPPGSAAASGNYYAFLQSDGAYISHRLTGVVGATATLTFSYSYRNATTKPTSYSVYWIPDYGSQVTISTGTIATLTGWVAVTTTWTLSSYYSGVIKFINNSPGVADNAVLIDNVSVTFPSTNSTSDVQASSAVYCLAKPVISSVSFAGTFITINWSTVANVNTSGNAYLFYYNGQGVPLSLTPDSTGTPAISAISTVTTTGLDLGTPGTNYYIQMVALGTNSVSAISENSATILCIASITNASVTVTLGGPGNIKGLGSVYTIYATVSWSNVTSATSYDVYASNSLLDPNTLVLKNSNITSPYIFVFGFCSATATTPATVTLKFYIRAIQSSSSYSNSNIATYLLNYNV